MAAKALREVTLRWLGVSSLVLQHRDSVLALDPFVSRLPWRHLLWGRAQPNEALAARLLPRCQALLITHAHFDHLMDAPGIARRTGAVICGTANTCTLAHALGVPQQQVRQVAIGERLSLAPFEVEVWPGDHPWIPGFTAGPLRSRLRPPLRLRDYRMDGCLSYLVQIAGWRVLVYHARRVAPLPQADVLCLSMAQSRAFYQQVLEQVRPRLVIPLHWDDMFRPLSEPLRPFWAPPRWSAPLLRRLNPDGFEAMIANLDCRVRVLTPQPLREYHLSALLTIA